MGLSQLIKLSLPRGIVTPRPFLLPFVCDIVLVQGVLSPFVCTSIVLILLLIAHD